MRALPLLLLFLSVAAHAQDRKTYRVEANDTSTVSLNLCAQVVRIEARGDGDTDVDFVITNPQGAVVHEDRDRTDLTFATIRRNATGCSPYRLRMTNLGNVYNDVVVTLIDQRSAGTADARDRRVTVYNDGTEPIFWLYASRTTTNRWEEDMLGTRTLSAGTSIRANIDDGSGACRYDFKAKFRSGREMTRMDVNVCSVTEVRFR